MMHFLFFNCCRVVGYEVMRMVLGVGVSTREGKD